MSAVAMKPSEALRKARELITPEGAWTQNVIARDAQGNGKLTGWKEDAVCWCAYGALEYVTKEHWGGGLSMWFRPFLDTVGSLSLDEYNDSHSHAEVMVAFDCAIAAADAKGE